MGLFANTVLFKRLTRISKLNELAVFNIVFNDPRVKDLIIEMNTQDQLYEKGIDALSMDLKSIGGDYSDVTKDVKSYFNEPYEHITLKDTGDFYKSFRVKAINGSIIISADTIKDEDDLTDRWGSNILGLTKESREKLVQFAKVYYIREVKRQIWK